MAQLQEGVDAKGAEAEEKGDKAVDSEFHCELVFVFWDFEPFWKSICTDHTRKACRHCALSLYGRNRKDKLSCHLRDFVHHLPLLRGVLHDNHDNHLLGYLGRVLQVTET